MKQSHSIAFGLAAAAALALGAGTLPAHAQLKGCQASDPILTLSNGQTERIIVTAPRGATVRLDVTLPRGVRVLHTWSDGLLRERIVLHTGAAYRVSGQIWDVHSPLKPRISATLFPGGGGGGVHWCSGPHGFFYVCGARPNGNVWDRSALQALPDAVGIGLDGVGGQAAQPRALSGPPRASGGGGGTDSDYDCRGSDVMFSPSVGGPWCAVYPYNGSIYPAIWG